MNKKIFDTGLVHGVFDIIHVGHTEHFREAKKKVKYLIASVTDDKFVNKGPNRPAFNIYDRVRLLKSIKYIDEVLVSKNETAVENIKKIKPNIYFKGHDYYKTEKESESNLNKEIKEVKKYGGKFFVTESKLRSSSKILNENFNYISKDLRKFLKLIDKNKIIKEVKKILFKNNSQSVKTFKILLAGEQILDYYTSINLQGKSQKSSIISTTKIKTVKYGGGSILVANFFSEFFENISYLVSGDSKIKKKIKTYISNKNKIEFITTGFPNKKILVKERFIENYSNARLFQLNHNQENPKKENERKLFRNCFLSYLKKIRNIVIFDYGYGSFDDQFCSLLRNKRNNFYINCQTNSSNFGYNLFTKYKKAKILCVDSNEFRLSLKNKDEKILDLIVKNKKFLKIYEVFIVTCGADGCYIFSKNKIDFIPAVFKSTLDTTGAGDIFFSCFIFFYIEKKFSLKEIALLSHIAAGLHCLTIGNKNEVNKNNFYQTLQATLK